MIPFDGVEINTVEVVFASSLDFEIMTLVVEEGSGLESLMGGINEATIKIYGFEGEGLCVFCGGKVGWRHGV